jgi:hypothetical protein
LPRSPKSDEVQIRLILSEEAVQMLVQLGRRVFAVTAGAAIGVVRELRREHRHHSVGVSGVEPLPVIRSGDIN